MTYGLNIVNSQHCQFSTFLCQDDNSKTFPFQLDEIRRVKLSRVICDNSDKIEDIQVYAMVLPDHEINPRVPCNSNLLPRIDLTRFRGKNE